MNEALKKQYTTATDGSAKTCNGAVGQASGPFRYGFTKSVSLNLGGRIISVCVPNQGQNSVTHAKRI